MANRPPPLSSVLSLVDIDQIPELVLPGAPPLRVESVRGRERKNFVWKKAAQETELKKVAQKAATTLATITSALDKPIEPEINDKFQLLYQRNAQLSEVSKTHETWKVQLAKFGSENIDPFETDLNDLVEAIALVASEKEIATTVSALQPLGGRLHSLKRKNQGLILSLQSEDVSNMLEMYKRLVKGCENLRKQQINVKITELAKFFQEIEREFPKITTKSAQFAPLIKSQIESLQEELLQFFYYSIRGFDGEVPANNEDLKGQSTRLKSAIEKELRKFTVIEDYTQPLPAKADLRVEDKLVDQFINSCKIETLPDTAYFRCGQFFTTTPIIGPYVIIREEKQALEAIAQKMHNLVKHIDERTKSIAAGNLPADPDSKELDNEKLKFEQAVGLLEQEIRHVRSKLLRKDFSDKVHAGLAYVAQLSAHAQEIRVHIELFGRYGINSSHPFIRTQSKLIQFLNPQEPQFRDDPSYFTSFEAVKRLYEVSKACAALVCPPPSNDESIRIKRKTYSMVDDIISKIGPRTLLLSEEEKALPAKIVAGVVVCGPEDPFLPVAVRSYLAKRITEFLYSTQKAFDPELDLMLHILSKQAPFLRSRRSDLVFADLLQSYSLYSDWEANKDHLIRIADIFKLLHGTDFLEADQFEKSYRVLCNFCEAQQRELELFHNLPQGLSGQQLERFKWAREQIKEKSKQIATNEAASYPEYMLDLAGTAKMSKFGLSGVIGPELPKFFYKSLVLAFWSSNDYEKSDAHQALLNTISNYDLNNLPRSGPVGTLLHKWLLDHFWHDHSHTEKFIAFVTLLLREYVADPQVRLLWRKVFDIGFMEVSLFRALRKEEEGTLAKPNALLGPLAQLIREWRRPTDTISVWREVVAHYDEFRLLFSGPVQVVDGNDRHTRALELIQNVTLKIQGQFVTHDAATITHVGIAKWCLEHMQEYMRTKVKPKR